MSIRGRDVKGDVSDTVDVCVIGSGAGGAVAAKELAEAGLSVVVLEAGEDRDSATFSRYAPEMLHRLFWDGGMRPTHDGSILIAQGRGVGGSTVHNLCYAVRTPDPVLERWRAEFGIHDLSLTDLAPSLDRVETALAVKQIEEGEVNALNQLVRQGCEGMGWHGVVQRHNREPCADCSAGCLFGCRASTPGRGKQSMAVSYIPRAVAAGARIYSDCLVEAIITENGRGGVPPPFSVKARLSATDGGDTNQLTIHSRAVVLAAGAINSPQLWLNSRLPDPGKCVGRNLHLHPAVFVGGVFDAEIDAYKGIPQSFYIDHFLDLERNPDSGYILMPLFGPPVLVAASMPSFGQEHRALMDNYRHIAGLLVLLHDRSAGRVTVRRNGSPVIHYRLSQADRALLVEGMLNAARLLFAAGANEIVVPYTRRVVIKGLDDLEVIRQRGVVENDILLASSHPQGTLRMGCDPRRSVVNSYGEAHAIEGLFVVDASLFPTSIGIPPMLTVAAMSDRIARRLANNWPP